VHVVCAIKTSAFMASQDCSICSVRLNFKAQNMLQSDRQSDRASSGRPHFGGSIAGLEIRRVSWKDFDGAVASAGTHRICLMLEGSAAELDVSDAFQQCSYRLSAGAVKTTPAGLAQLLRLKGDAETLIVDLPDALVANVLAQGLGMEIEDAVLTPSAGAGDPIMARLMLSMMDEAERCPADQECVDLSRLSSAALGEALAVQFVRRSVSAAHVGIRPQTQVLGLRQIRRVMDFIHARLADPLSLTDLACAAGTSRAHFARGFRSMTGYTPMAYVQKRRIEKAQALLLGTDQSVLEIALAAGFQNQSHFAVVFRRTTGLSPNQYRRGNE
jgi:AraC-like DNA-binding protein